MFGKLFDENMITAIMNAPKMCKEMDNKRIDMSALEFMCAVPIVAKVLEMSNKERKGAIDFASAVVALNITEKGKKLFNEPVQKFKNELLTKFAQTEITPENTAESREPKKDESTADAAQTESVKSKLPENLQELLDDPDVPEKIKKAIMAAADVDADIEIIRVKGKKG